MQVGRDVYLQRGAGAAEGWVCRLPLGLQRNRQGGARFTSVGTNDAAACAQALAKVNLTNKAQSILIQAPAGTHSHLGGKVEDPQAYTAALLGWMNNE